MASVVLWGGSKVPAVAGMLSIIRWRLDGMARSFWYGLASIVGMVPLLGMYSFFLLLTPSISELGRSAPFENQAFLGPVPYAQWRQPPQVREESAASHPQQDDDDQSQPDRSRDQQQPEQAGPAGKQAVGQP